MDYLVSIESAMTERDMGYYIADTDDGGTPEATLWYFYTQSSDPRDIVQVSITNEVNYLTSYDGHLWNADSNSSAWADMGVIQGADGVDGISVTLDPATVIFEQNEDNINTFTPSPSSFTATVNVWKGTTPLASNSYKVAIQSTTNCTATTAGNQITSLTLGQVRQGVYFSSGSVVLGVWLDPTSTSQTPDTTLTFNWAANLLGTWKASVVNDAYKSVSSKPIAIINSNGEIETKTFETIFQQTAEYIMLDVDGFAGKTGIDLEDGTITLKANKVTFTNSSGTVSDKISIDPTTGTLHAVDGIFEGTLDAKSYLTRFADLITYCYCETGVPHPSYIDKFLIPGYYTKMYDYNNQELDIKGIWCFRVADIEIWLPTNIDGLVGQRIVLYNPYVGYEPNAKTTTIHAGEIVPDENETVADREIIRGVGLPVSSTDPVLINQYDPVYEIQFVDGVVELQCMPSDEAGKYQCQNPRKYLRNNIFLLCLGPYKC